MDAHPKISTIVITYRRDDALAATLERLLTFVKDRDDHELVLIDNNADGIDRTAMVSGFPRARVVMSDANLGVAEGRNEGIVAAEGDILVFLDDDALLLGDADLYTRLEARFNRDRHLGVIAFRSHMRELGVSDPIEFPHTDKELPRDESFETFRYIGVGHAIRGDAIRRVGGYYTSFFYGMEEFEMSFRLMHEKWKIVYDPAFAVIHMKANAGRLPSVSVMQRMFTNKLCLAWMHLPLKEMTLCTCAWTIKTVLDTRSPLAPFRSVCAAIRNIRADRMSREPKPDVVEKISILGGIAWR